MSQISSSEHFPTQIFGVNIVEDYILNYMSRCVFNTSFSSAASGGNKEDSQLTQWNSLQKERVDRQNYNAETFIARMLYRLTAHEKKRRIVVKALTSTIDNVLFRFLLHCVDVSALDAAIHVVLTVI